MGRRQFDAGVNGFIIQINEKIPFLFLSIVSKRNRKQCLSVSIKLKKHFLKFGITQKSCSEHLPVACVPIFSFPKLHSCFYDTVETWIRFPVS